MSHQQGGGEESTHPTTTITVWAYDTCTYRLNGVLPKWLNPFYRQTKRTIDAAMATSTILSDKRGRELVESYDCLTDVDVTELVSNPASGQYRYGQQITYTFDASTCDQPEQTAWVATKQLVTADHIEIV